MSRTLSLVGVPLWRPAWVVALGAILVALCAMPLSAAAAAQPPSIATLAPASVPTGEHTVTLTGTDLTDVEQIRFYDDVSQYESIGYDITEVSPTEVQFRVSFLVAGTYAVSVTTPSGSSTPSGPGDDAFVVTARAPVTVSPDSGPIEGGNLVVVSGGDVDYSAIATASFGSPNAGGLAADIVDRAANSIILRAPAGYNQGTSIIFLDADGQQLNGFEAGYRWEVTTPIVASVSPNQGPLSGGTEVRITGTGFFRIDAITFGGIAADPASIRQLPDGSLTVLAPASASSGTVDISVRSSWTAVGSTPSATAADDFTYADASPRVPVITSIVPSIVPAGKSWPAVIAGRHLGAGAKVTVGGRPARVLLASSGLLLVKLPALPVGRHPVVVTSREGVSSRVTAATTILAR